MRCIPSLAMVLALACPTMALAQTAPRPAAPAPAAPAPAPPPATLAPAPQPIRQEITTYDNWTVNCQEFADRRRTCSAVLQVVQQQNNQILFSWIVGKNNAGRLINVLQVPTGVSIVPGVEVKPAKGAARKATYANCEASRCEAVLDMDDAFVRDASGSETMEATVYGTAGQGVKFALPFKGFDKALAATR